MLRRILVLTAPIALLISLVAQPATSVPVTTLVRTIQDLDGDNRLEFGPGEDYTVFGADQAFRPPRASIINFLQMTDFQIVDEESPARVEFLDTTQRTPFNPFSAAYRPQESLTAQVTEAMVRAARNTVSPITQERLDLTILTGDNADSQQYNETRWFIDILDGHKKVNPNSGIPTSQCPDPTPKSVYDGVRNGGDAGYYEPNRSVPDENQTPFPDTTAGDGQGYSPNRVENQGEVQRDVTVRDFPRLFEAANHPFEAIGLDMPWYSAFGNHDALVQGNSHEAYTGPFGPDSEQWLPPINVAFHQIATGCIKPSNLAASPLFPDEPRDPDEEPSTVLVPPDVRRCFLTKDTPPTPPPAPASPCNDSSWIGEHFNTTGTPLGHGFEFRPPEAIANHDGYYSFVPTAGLRFIVLDTVTDECGPPVAGFCSEGSVDDTQFNWLRSEIDDAAGEGQYVMVFSHHTLRTTRWPTADLTEEPVHFGQRIDPMDPGNPQNLAADTLHQLFCQNPNVLAHIAGHEHQNYVWHYHCNTHHVAGAPEGLEDSLATGPGDFWHISTAAHIDWPQQSRMIELIDNGNATMSLALTILDHAGPPNPGNARDLQPNRGQSGEQVLKLASIARELSYNDYQNVTPLPSTGMAARPSRGGPQDRNVLIVLDRPWPCPSTATADECFVAPPQAGITEGAGLSLP